MSTPSTSEIDDLIRRAAAWIREADGLLIGAGAGMGVDSGLPDFRGPEGFWRAYPPFRDRGLRFEEVADPRWFVEDPPQAWGFYGHRRNLYRATAPHHGFAILKRWADLRPQGGFVFTSNVDGHFQRAGFAEEQILECHGSVEFDQCVRACDRAIRRADAAPIDIDEATFRARQPLPVCPACGGTARPNVLMFNDFGWLPEREYEQRGHYRRWRNTLSRLKLVAIELGAGTAIPTVRYECERVAERLIRINPRESQTPRGQIGLPLGAVEALERLDAALSAAN